MTNSFLFEQIKAKASFLCVGLDIDLDKIPSHLLQEEDPIFAFAKAIIDATYKYSVAYKPNLAFFESYGVQGLHAFKKVINYLNTNIQTILLLQTQKEAILETPQGGMQKLSLIRIILILLLLPLIWVEMLLSLF